jgi:glycosyltransferase involved in cell wall biosynthesis
MNRIVVSGVNLTEGGILSILEDCLSSLKSLKKENKIEVIVFVHSKELVKKYLNDFIIVEYPKIKKSWFRRLYFEYIYSRKLSIKFKPDLWISLHDMTPRVTCDYQVVYCHNPSPFYDLPLNEILLDFKFFLFNKFYKYLYQINIKKNKYVIVQQDWLRKEFNIRYGVKSIVAKPSIEFVENLDEKIKNIDTLTRFFYPSFPRVFKNFEILLEASVILSKTISNFEVVITLNGSENRYSKLQYEKYGKYNFIKFVGLQPRDKVYKLYEQTDCLVFPSKLETWGLPLSEMKFFNKVILAADLPYAHETVGEYKKIKFFDPNNAQELAKYMEAVINNKLKYDLNSQINSDYPSFSNWDSLHNFLIKSSNKDNNEI